MVTIDTTANGEVEVRTGTGILLLRTPYRNTPISVWWFMLVRLIWKELFARFTYPEEN